MSETELYACVDVGTTRIKLSLYDGDLRRKHLESVTVPVGADGHQDAEELFRAVKHLFGRAKELGARSVGLATYRTSTVAWDKEGKPLTPVVTWTDRSVAMTYRHLPAYVKAIRVIPPFDLVISPYSPVMKFLRLREINPSVGQDTMQWTIDSYLAYRLTGKFVSDATNACLTGFVHPKTMKEIGLVKSLFNLRFEIPEMVENAQNIGTCDGLELNALIADQQAASVGELAIERGVAKVTNSTGTFVDIPTAGYSTKGGLTPMVLLMHKGQVCHGVEGYLFTTGAAVDRLLAMGLLRDYSDLEIEGDGGVIFVPALSGLQGAANAKGVIAGLTLGSDRRSVVSGFRKSVAFHVRLTLEQSGERLRTLRANGGLSKSTALLKTTSAATGLPVERLPDLEATSRGLAMLQLVATGKATFDELSKVRAEAEVFSEKADSNLEEEYRKWKNLTELLKSSKGSYLAE